jgi:hypothetical protein
LQDWKTDETKRPTLLGTLQPDHKKRALVARGRASLGFPGPISEWLANPYKLRALETAVNPESEYFLDCKKRVVWPIGKRVIDWR